MDETKYVARILPVFRAIFVHPLGSGYFLAHAISKFTLNHCQRLNESCIVPVLRDNLVTCTNARHSDYMNDRTDLPSRCLHWTEREI